MSESVRPEFEVIEGGKTDTTQTEVELRETELVELAHENDVWLDENGNLPDGVISDLEGHRLDPGVLRLVSEADVRLQEARDAVADSHTPMENVELPESA